MCKKNIYLGFKQPDIFAEEFYMKILPVSHKELRFNNIPSRNKALYTTNINQTALSNVFLGKDLVSFKSKDFNQTVKDNYFKLPPDCVPDEFQLESAKGIYEGKNVIVEAPTGTGKTAIANYAASKNLQDGKKTIYTAPLKALSNQKFNEFCKNFDGQDGIITGDRKVNPEAPVLIMTTEVYRNMLLKNMFEENKNPLLDNVSTVIFDELHYMDDDDRGTVWEEAIMYSPQDTQILALSATIGNAPSVLNWIDSIKDKQTKLVSLPESKRYVPLEYNTINTQSYAEEDRKIRQSLKKGSKYESKRAERPQLGDYKKAINKINNANALPAIIFVFSKRFSRDILEYLAIEGKDLTTKEEKDEINEIINKYNEKGYLGDDINMEALEKGYAIHNAGIIPEQKELIEELFQKKLLKVVLATETLAAGINMPAKTVLISRPYKPGSSNNNNLGGNLRVLTPNEFKQMSGRAGRRGIDNIGYVYTLSSDKNSETEFARLTQAPCNPIRSKFNPDYSFLSMYYAYNPNDNYLKDIFNRSFYVNANPQEKSKRLNELQDLTSKRKQVMLQRGFIKKQDNNITPSIKGLMSSELKGYDNLNIIEAIANGSFKGITPENLASVAGFMANPAAKNEDAILDISPDNVFTGTEDYLLTVYDNLKNSVIHNLKKYGKTFEDFNSLEEMIEFANSIDAPVIDKFDVKSKMNRLDLIIKKTEKINSNQDMTLQEINTATENGDTIPSAVLQKTFDYIENYKKSTNIDGKIMDLTNKINQLEEKINSPSKKSRKKYKTQVNKLSEELRQIQIIKKLDDEIFRLLNENYTFTRKYDYKSSLEQYAKLSDLYEKSQTKNQLVSGLSALKAIEEWTNNNDFSQVLTSDKKKFIKTADGFIKNTIEINKTEQDAGLKNEIVKYETDSANLLYNWAMLNKINPDGLSNWKAIVKSGEFKLDEGSIYRKIMQTADLLGQIKEIAIIAKNMAQTPDEKEYYEQLLNTSIQAKELIIKEPIHL